MPEYDYDSSQEEVVKLTSKVSVTEGDCHDIFIESVKDQIRTITVEPLMMMYIIIMYLQASVIGQYLYYRVGVDFNIVVNETSAHVCTIDANNTDKNLTDRLQSLNTQYSMYIQISTSITTILTAPFYCLFSDRFGRRVMFILPAIGLLIKTAVEIVIQVYRLSLLWLVITEGLYGLCGGFNFVMALSHCYIADITTQKNRTKRIAILGVMIGAGALVVSLISGYWISISGYLIPYIFTGALAVGCVIYPIVYLKEPPKIHDSRRSKTSALQQLKNLVTIYTNHPRAKAALLIIIFFLFNFYSVAEMSNLIIASTYLMSYPICMNVLQISVFSFVSMFSINVGVGITVLLLVRWLSDLVLVFFCLLSGIAFSLQMAFATSMVSALIAAASNLFSFSAFPFIRGYMSKKISSQDQGALFGSLALSETISGSITRVISVYFYGATFQIFHGMVYLFLTCFSVIALGLVAIAITLDRKVNYARDYSSLNVNSIQQ